MEHDHNAEQNLWGAMLRSDKRSFNAIHDLYVADSIANANQDISLSDLAGITPNARLVILDACG